MENRLLEQILVGSTVAFFTAIINGAVAGNINPSVVLGGFFVSIIAYGAYQKLRRFPFKKWRVTKVFDGKGLLFRDDILEGKYVGEAFQFRASKKDWAVYGPYLRQSLSKGKYRATFKIKVDDISGDDRTIVKIDVASNCRNKGDKRLVGRTLSRSDFTKADEYHKFPLDFYVKAHERELELRIYSEGHGEVVTLDYIQLSPRLF